MPVVDLKQISTWRHPASGPSTSLQESFHLCRQAGFLPDLDGRRQAVDGVICYETIVFAGNDCDASDAVGGRGYRGFTAVR